VRLRASCEHDARRRGYGRGVVRAPARVARRAPARVALGGVRRTSHSDCAGSSTAFGHRLHLASERYEGRVVSELVREREDPLEGGPQKARSRSGLRVLPRRALALRPVAVASAQSLEPGVERPERAPRDRPDS